MLIKRRSERIEACQTKYHHLLLEQSCIRGFFVDSLEALNTRVLYQTNLFRIFVVALSTIQLTKSNKNIQSFESNFDSIKSNQILKLALDDEPRPREELA